MKEVLTFFIKLNIKYGNVTYIHPLPKWGEMTILFEI